MKHILVVDDDRLNLVLAYDTLKSFYSVSVVNSGIQALKFLESREVDLILLDIEMPVMNGIETLKKIKSVAETSEIPVIFLTGLDDSRIEAQCIELGAQDYIVKPFYAPGMLVRIRRILELNELRKNLENLVQEKQKKSSTLRFRRLLLLRISLMQKTVIPNFIPSTLQNWQKEWQLNLDGKEQKSEICTIRHYFMILGRLEYQIIF